MNPLPTIREQVIAQMEPAFQREALLCLLPLLAFSAYLLYATVQL